MNEFFLDNSLLNELAVAFSNLADIKIAIFDTNGNVLAGEDEDSFDIEDVLYCLNKLGDIGVESLVDVADKNISAIAMRNSSRTLLGIWMISRGSCSEHQFKQLIQSIDTIVSGFVSEGEVAYSSFTYAESIRQNSDGLSNELIQAQAITEILKKLESEDEYEVTCVEILEQALKYLEADEIALIEKGNNDSINYFAHVKSKDTDRQLFREKSYSRLPFADGLSYTISSDSRMPTNFRDFLDEEGLSAGIFLPLYTAEGGLFYLCLVLREKQRRWALAQTKFINDVKRVLCVVLSKGSAWDLHKAAWKTLEDILENIPNPVYVCDFGGEDTLYTNRAFEETFADADDRAMILQKVSITPENDEEIAEYHILGLDKYARIKFAAFPWSDGRMVRLVSVYDTNDNRKYEEEMEQKAALDEVTGVFNRQRFSKGLATAIAEKKSGVILVLNIDGFKDVNISCGFDSGDSLLVSVAGFLKKFENEHINIYRVGSDEFALLINDKGSVNVDEICSSIQKRFKAPWQLTYKDSFLMASMAIVEFDGDSADYSSVLRAASIALSEAKNIGPGNMCVFEKKMEENVKKRILTSNFLKDAVESKFIGMELVTNPVEYTAINGKTFMGDMASMVWETGELGKFEENEYIPLAKKLGIYKNIVGHKISSVLKAGRDKNDFGYPANRMGVGVAFQDLVEVDLVSILRQHIVSSGIDPQMVVLCINGEYPPADSGIEEVLNQIKDLGIHVYISPVSKALQGDIVSVVWL